MVVHKILTEPNPILRQISKAVEIVTDEHRQLMNDMLDTMYDAPGIGLAAIQIGKPLRIIVIDISDREENQEKSPLYFVNPEIISVSEELKPYKEGCLSVPEIYDMVERPAVITVRFVDYYGNPQIINADGLLAVCLQHEIDHLNGVLFIDKLSKLKKKFYMQKLRKNKNIKLI